MENNLIIQNNQQPATRDINIITDEILIITNQAQYTALAYIIELGRRLTEAKSLLKHGEWAEWLKNKVSFSQSTATSYMRIFDEYGSSQQLLFGGVVNSQALVNLPHTKILKLLAIPKDEREDFIEQNDVENISTRELDKIIKERNQALKDAEKAQKEAEEYKLYKEKAEASQEKATKAEAELLKAQLLKQDLEKELAKMEASLSERDKTIKDLKDKPTISPKEMNEIKEKAKLEAEKALKKQLEEASEREKKALLEKQEAQRESEEAKQRIAELEKKAKMADSNVTEFKAFFERLQTDANSCLNIVEKVSKNSPEMAEKLKSALKKLGTSLSKI